METTDYSKYVTPVRDFLINEYNYCDANIQFIHNQRDRWIRFYITFIGALQGFAIAMITLAGRNGVDFDLAACGSYIWVSSVSLYAIGVLVLLTTIYARCRTAEFTNQINSLRDIIFSKFEELDEQTIVLPRSACIEAYQHTGADFFRHLFLSFVVSMFVMTAFIGILESNDATTLGLGIVGVIVSNFLLLALRRVILCNFDKRMKERTSHT